MRSRNYFRIGNLATQYRQDEQETLEDLVKNLFILSLPFETNWEQAGL